MYRVKVNKQIEQIISFLYKVRIWHREDEETVAHRRLKWFYSIYYFLFLVTLMAGAIESDNRDEFLFLIEASIISFVLFVKLLYLIWRKREIIEQLNIICDYCVEDQATFTQINNKLNSLTKFVTVSFSLAYFCGICAASVVPFLGTEKTLFFNIGFPLDWKNNVFAYWIAFIFVFTQIILTSIAPLISVIIWHLMANCGLRLIDNFGLFVADLFLVQLATSAFCICTSVYSLVFNRGDNLIENLINLIILLYNIFDIFMSMYFGDEIKLSSNRLSYSLFESNWVDRSQSIKKNVLIFGEFLMKPHQLVILKLYPLTLATFTRILNSAYSMFNILQNLN